MSRYRLCLLLVTAALVLSGCAGPAPLVTAVATAAPSAAQPTSAATPTAAAPHDLVPVDHLNPQTQARLRLADLVAGGPNVDVWVNGALEVIGGQPQVNFPADFIGASVYLQPGTYHIAVVPTGQGLAQPLVSPLDVPVAAGHRYTLAVIGQLADKSVKTLVIDETDAELKAGAVPTDDVRLWVDNLAGGPAVDIQKGGSDSETLVSYGSAAAAAYPAGNFGFVARLTGQTSAYINYDQPYNLPGTSTMTAFIGTSGANSDEVDGVPTSELNVIQYLRGFTGKDVTLSTPVSFKFLLQAIATANFTDTLIASGPHVLLAPTDAAFKDMPGLQRQALLADPQAVDKLLRNLTVTAYVPHCCLASRPGAVNTRVLTNMLGTTFSVGDGWTINGQDTGDLDSIFLADGSQIHLINLVLLPATP